MSATKNKMADLRNHLFQALERLNDTDAKNELHMGAELERAKAIAEVAQVLVNSAKVEVEYIKATDRDRGSEFLAEPEENPRLTQDAASRRGLSTGKFLGQATEVPAHGNGNGNGNGRKPA